MEESILMLSMRCCSRRGGEETSLGSVNMALGTPNNTVTILLEMASG